MRESGDVAARPRQAVDKAGADRIGDDREHDRHGAGRLQQRRHGRSAVARMTSGASATNSAACLAKRSAACPRPSGCRSARCGRRSSPIAAVPAGTPRCGLALPDRPRSRGISTPMRRMRSACCARAASGQRRRAAEQRDELAPPHSITSSARASSVGGTVEAERLRGLEIDDQLVLGRRLHRQVGRLLALENAVDVAGRAAVLVEKIRPIGDQPAAGDEERDTDRPRADCAGPQAR